jgi:hypothetical protein
MLKGTARSILPWGVLILMLFRAIPAIAGIIQIETHTSVTVTDGIPEVAVTATNKGDEPAYKIEAHLIVLGKRLSHKGKDVLRQAESETVVFRNIPSPSKRGTYPLITRITFQDTNHHPFSAVSCSSFPIGESANSALECLGKAISITRRGLKRFAVKNNGSQSLTASANLVLPDELSTPVPKRELVIEAGAEEELLFEISNFSALVGAVYPVFCYLEYDSGDAHHSEVGNSSVRIVEEENWFKRARPIWLGLAIITGVILVACQLKRKGP